MSKDQQMFSSSTANTLMSPFQQYYFPSSSPYYQPFQPLPQPQPPLPPPPPPPPPAIPSLIPNPSDNIFLHQSHQYNHLFSLANAQIPENSLINLGVISNTTTTTMANIMTSTSTTSSTKQDLIINCGGSRHSAPNFIRKKPGAAVSKKDRHSKISTAQGLRDRRVRLSIDIAREFFDLHDMLGFDKASKTLEWLLTKSKKAIKEVSRNKLRTSTAAKSSTTLSSTGAANSDHCEQAMSEMNELVAAAADHDINLPTEEEEEEEDHNSLLVSKQELIDAERLSEAASMNLLAKESRAKARAKEKRHNNYCTTTTSTTAYTNNSHKIRPSNYDNNKEKFSSREGSSSHQISNHQLLIRSVLLNQLDHHPDIDHGQIQRLTPNSVEEKGLLFRMQANHDHYQDDYDEEEPVLMIKKKLYDHCDDHEEGQFCGISSKGGASNNVVYSSSPSILLTQNWDNNNRIGTASPHPAASFCLPT